MRRPIPFSERCTCGARKLKDSAFCRTCKRRHERSFAVPGRDVAFLPSKPVSVAHNAEERHQDAEIEELSRCLYCGQPFGGHLATCWGRIEDLDSHGFEYHNEVDL